MKFKILILSAVLILFFIKFEWSEKIRDDQRSEFENCTSILVTKEASFDGSVITTHSCDGGYDFRLRVIPGRMHSSGEMRPVYKGGGNGAERRQAEKVGEIPEVRQTFSRFDIAYSFMNEKQLGMGETTFGGRQELYNPEGMFDIMELQKIVLERTSTAREAIQLIGELVAEHGYGDFGECLTFIDKNEAWVLEILGAGPLELGAVWAAQRIPAGEVFAHANHSRIGELNLEDKENFMASENVISMAEEMEWWEPDSGEPFRFNHAYNPGNPIYSRRRIWRVFNTLAPHLKLDPWSKEYPFSIKPVKKVTLDALKSLHRDYYQNTEFDMSQGLAAGPFHNPNRINTRRRPPAGHIGWERSISIIRCSYCVILQSRSWLPDPIGGLAWFAEDDPKTSCFIPFYCGITEVPKSFQIGRRDRFNRESAWWAFDFVSNWANLRYSDIIQDIQKAYSDFENTFGELQPSVEKRAETLFKENPKACIEYLTRYSNETAQRVVNDWWALSDFLVVKYNDTRINSPGAPRDQGYPKWWLDKTNWGKVKIKNK